MAVSVPGSCTQLPTQRAAPETHLEGTVQNSSKKSERWRQQRRRLASTTDSCKLEKGILKQDLVEHAGNLSIQEAEQEDLCKFKTSLAYKVNSRLV